MNKGIVHTGFVLCIALLVAWEWFGQTNVTFNLLLSCPSGVLTFIVNNFELSYFSLAITAAESLSGLALAITMSCLVAVACIYSPRLYGLVTPIMVFSQVVPLIVLAPLLIMLMGIGMQGKIVMSAIMCFFPLFVGIWSGYRAIPRTILDLLFVYDATTWFSIRRVFFPLSTPHIFSGLKVSAPLSVIGAVVSEFTGAEYGLGKNIFVASKRLEPELMMSSILLVSLLGGIAFVLVRVVEGKLGKWYV